MNRQRLKGMIGLLMMGGVLAACFTGCRQTKPEPRPITTTRTSQTSTTTTTEPIPQTTTTTQTDPLGYVDLVDSEDWPWRIFHSVEGFVHWIENPNLKMEKSPLEPEKDKHGYDVYKRSYFDALYPDYQQMFAVDRFYMLPDVPPDWELTDIYVKRINVEFYYQDKGKNKYYLSYMYTNKTKKTIIENSSDTISKRSINNQEYYISDFLSELSPEKEKKGWIIKTFINGYLCRFSEKTYNPDRKEDPVTEGYERVIYSEDTDLTDVVSKIKFKRIDLPPLKK